MGISEPQIDGNSVTFTVEPPMIFRHPKDFSALLSPRWEEKKFGKYEFWLSREISDYFSAEWFRVELGFREDIDFSPDDSRKGILRGGNSWYALNTENAARYDYPKGALVAVKVAKANPEEWDIRSERRHQMDIGTITFEGEASLGYNSYNLDIVDAALRGSYLLNAPHVRWQDKSALLVIENPTIPRLVHAANHIREAYEFITNHPLIDLEGSGYKKAKAISSLREEIANLGTLVQGRNNNQHAISSFSYSNSTRSEFDVSRGINEQLRYIEEEEDMNGLKLPRIEMKDTFTKLYKRLDELIEEIQPKIAQVHDDLPSSYKSIILDPSLH